MKIALKAFVLSTLATFAQAGVPAADPKAVSSARTDDPWGGTLLGGGIKTNGDFTEGSLFLTQPLWDTIGRNGTMGGSLFFVEPYGTWGDGGESGGSLGLGFRHLFSSQSVQDAKTNRSPGFLGEGIYVGGNVFMDYDHTRLGSDFWQIGLGAEVGTRYLELRGNYYIPTSDERFLGRTTETFSRSSVRRSTSTTLGSPFVDANGNTVQNRIQRTTRTTSTTTVRRVTEFWEEPLEGWDAELSVLVPGIDKWMDVRLVGSYYSYHGNFLHVADVSGWRAGVEFRPVKAVVLSAMWYEKNQLYRDHWLVGVRFEIPLGKPMSQSFSTGYRHLAERLYEPVRRKNSAVSTSGTETTTTTTTTSGSSTVIFQSQNQIILSTAPPPPPVTSPQEEG